MSRLWKWALQYIGAPSGEPEEGGSFAGFFDRQEKKALEMEHRSFYRGSTRGTWSDGSYTEDSERHLTERSGIGAFLFIGAPKREPKVT
jgi:hypothetical protein